MTTKKTRCLKHCNSKNQSLQTSLKSIFQGYTVYNPPMKFKNRKRRLTPLKVLYAATEFPEGMPALEPYITDIVLIDSQLKISGGSIISLP